MTPLILLSAGGTGGHLFPAESLATALRERGARVVLATDERVGGLAEHFPAEAVETIPSGTPSGRSVLGIAKAALQLARGVMAARRLLIRLKPDAVVGFGGYPTVPPMIAAANRRIPTVLHEQNGVMGRANRFLAGRVDLIATGFPEVRGLPAGIRAKVAAVGNPVRPAVIEAAAVPYQAPAPGERLRLLVFGGSQGARVMSEIVPAAVAQLSAENRARLALVQQARGEDLERARAALAPLVPDAELEPFFRDLPARIAASHLVVARSGASTVAELAVIGRPAILVPLPGALDQDQAANARFLGTVGAATVVPQAEFTPERLAAEIASALDDPLRLTRAAAAAKSAGIADAGERLADLVLGLVEARRKV
jgi:UDP-N-acetylglucosamine--N-acetylmuramyl-(pentapeptide) pyrophosphoryl-undecaprenol N-acetylglucosamine transferase